ncbi:MAG: N-acetylmuramoyl-L-alanine amidase [Clostridia bacterium]|nr:N-acetylmuramoyl-L-alanine amidase [Clostridia bacterium]
MRKRSLIAAALAVVIGFLGAIGLCFSALALPARVSATPEMTIVIDAGHGGIDGGVTGVVTGIKESDLNLAISLKLQAKLSDAGYEVVMTRRTEGGLYDTAAPGFKRRDMQKRKEICEGASPLCVISVHQNFFPSRSQRGAQVFYDQGSEQGKALAEGLQTELNELYGAHSVKARKAMTGDYFMLKLSAPSVIVECGFLSNAKDEALLVSDDFQKKLVDRIAAGVIKNLSLWETV